MRSSCTTLFRLTTWAWAVTTSRPGTTTTTSSTKTSRRSTRNMRGRVNWVSARPAWSLGVRYEETDVTAVTTQAVPDRRRSGPRTTTSRINSRAERCAAVRRGELRQCPAQHRLLRSNCWTTSSLRASWSKTIARADYGQLFVAETAGTPPRATALGGIAGGIEQQHRPRATGVDAISTSRSRCTTAKPATSRSDSSTRTWRTSSVRAQVTRTMFGIRDPSSGAAGSSVGSGVSERSRRIPGALRNDVEHVRHDGDGRQSGSVPGSDGDFPGQLDQR